MISRGVEHVTGPIVPKATHTVTCACGAAFDMVADSDENALHNFQARHIHPRHPFENSKLTVTKIHK